MYTIEQIKSTIKELDINQIKSLLSEYYSTSDNKPASIYNAIDKSYDYLAHDLFTLVESGQIDMIVLIIESNS